MMMVEIARARMSCFIKSFLCRFLCRSAPLVQRAYRKIGIVGLSLCPVARSSTAHRIGASSSYSSPVLLCIYHADRAVTLEAGLLADAALAEYIRLGQHHTDNLQGIPPLHSDTME